MLLVTRGPPPLLSVIETERERADSPPGKLDGPNVRSFFLTRPLSGATEGIYFRLSDLQFVLQLQRRARLGEKRSAVGRFTRRWIDIYLYAGWNFALTCYHRRRLGFVHWNVRVLFYTEARERINGHLHSEPQRELNDFAKNGKSTSCTVQMNFLSLYLRWKKIWLYV